ncbi:MAG TPA: nucleotide-binding protein [Anaeromyxobacteraceae bacterium]|nr:nucleotide-binding protein [Anaeromyxobacteraceae bacterium]
MRYASVLAVVLAITACKKSEPPAPPQQLAQGGVPAQPPDIKGKVAERIDAAPYSYLRLTTGQGEIWAAVPQTNVANGAEVTVEGPMQMDGWESKTLNRKFDKLVFGTLAGQPRMGPVGGPAQAGGPAAQPGSPAAQPGSPAAQPAMPPGMPPGAAPAGIAAQHAAAGAGPTDVGSVKVEKAAGPDARTVLEIHNQRARLKEKKVAVRGKVVKFTAGIMGRNWVHLRDGTGVQDKGTNDLTVTTGDTAAVGDVVVAKGVVRIDKDFGAGYAYPVIVEEAKLSK